MASDTNKESVAYQREKREFIDGLRHFHSTRGTPIGKLPRFGASEVDLYFLYQRVTSMGGWKKVNDEQRWEELFAEFSLPKGCLNGERALRHIYIRYLNLYEKVNFFGEDANQKEQHEDEGPLRKKRCGPQYGVPLSYKYSQHAVPEERREGAGLSTLFAKHSDYERLEMALLSGLPNEVDFVINVCTLLSNESKHTLRLEKSTQLTDLLLAHVGIFHKGAKSLERLYENGWRKSSCRDFIRFWFDNIKDPTARDLVSYTRDDQKKAMVGSETLHLGRDLGVEDKEGIRITQVAIIIRNLSFDEDNMKYLASNDLIFRFLYLCVHCNYGTLRQLALDTIGNLAAQFVLDPMDSWRSQTTIDLLIKCLGSTDKFAVVRGLEMLCKLSQLPANEFALSEKLDVSIYEEIAKYLTIQDIQLIVSSLEALYQLSELGESTTSKIAEVSNTIDTLVSLITVEAQSYGPNSLVGIKVVEYCPPPHLTGGVTEGVPGAVGPPPTQAQPPGQQQKIPPPVVQTATAKVHASQIPPPAASPQPPRSPAPTQAATQSSPEMEATTCNWLQGTYEAADMGMVPHLGLYSDYLDFCKKFNLTEALASQKFLATIKTVFPTSSTVINVKDGGSKVLCIQGISKRPEPLPFSISTQVSKPRSFVAPSSPYVTPVNTSVTRSPTLLQRLTAPLRPQTPHAPLYPTGVAIQHSFPQTPIQNLASPQLQQSASSTQLTYSVGGSIPAQGYITPNMGTQTIATTPTTASKKKNPPRKLVSKGKKQANILPRPEQSPGNVPVVPKTAVVPNVQYTNIQPEVVYQTIDPNVRNLLAKKLRQGGSIIIQPAQQYVGAQQVVVNDIGSVADTNQLQYQTSSYPQNIQQTTYIQYTNPMNSAQTNVQAVQPNQTSAYQTFMVQPGNMLIHPNQPHSSGLPHQQIISQPIITQQQMVAQPHVMSQHQMVAHPQVVAPSPQIVTAQPIITQQSISQQFISQPTVITNQQPLLMDPSISSMLVSQSEGASFPSQNITHSSFSTCLSTETQPQKQLAIEVCVDMNQGETTVNPVENVCIQGNDQNVDSNDISAKYSEINSAATPENVSSPKLPDQSELDKSLEEEIESAVNSLMDDNTCETGSEQINENTGNVNENVMMAEDTEEPVMIENDGNELMFEPGYNQSLENNVIDEVASAVENLEQFSTLENEAHFCDDPVKSALETSGIFDEGDDDLETNEMEDTCVLMNGVDSENAEIRPDQITEKDQSMLHENVNAVVNETAAVQNEAVTAASAIEEQEIVTEPVVEKPRPETPIIIPVISENGLFEQDFEARMAVENLLKDVEFNVNGNYASSEENVAVYACPLQENPDSVRTTSSAGDSELLEDSRDGMAIREKTPESQVVTTNSSCLHRNGPVVSKSSAVQNNSCLTQNGMGSVLMNGNLSSPDMSVPSPTYIPNGGDTKLVNGLEYDKPIVTKSIDKVSKLNGLVNHKHPTNQVLEVYHSQVTGNVKMEKTDQGIQEKVEVKSEERDILAQSILVNDIQPSDADFTYPEPTTTIIPQVVKQYIPNQLIGNTMTVNCVQINNNTIPVVGSNCYMFTNNTILTSKVQLSSPITVCNSRHVPTPEMSRDDLSCDSTTSSVGVGGDLSVVIPDKHSTGTQSKASSKTAGKKPLASPRQKSGGDGKKVSEKKPKKRSRSKSGGSAADSRPSSTSSATSAPMPEYMCEWAQCKKCFDNAKSLFPHVCSAHLKTEFSGVCQWEGCEHLVRKRWSLFTHVQDHHCSEHSLRAAAHRRLQAFQAGQTQQNPTIPAMVYPNDAAVQAIKRFAPRAPYHEFLEGREGPVTKHIRLTSALILRNLARYSRAGRSLLKKHERVISYTCMSAVESSNALSNCLYEVLCITDS